MSPYSFPGLGLTPTMETIRRFVLKETGFDVKLVSREKEVIHARRLFYYLVFKNVVPVLKLREVAEFLSLTHGTISVAIRNINREIELYPKLRKEFESAQSKMLSFTQKELSEAA